MFYKFPISCKINDNCKNNLKKSKLKVASTFKIHYRSFMKWLLNSSKIFKVLKMLCWYYPSFGAFLMKHWVLFSLISFWSFKISLRSGILWFEDLFFCNHIIKSFGCFSDCNLEYICSFLFIYVTKFEYAISAFSLLFSLILSFL